MNKNSFVFIRKGEEIKMQHKGNLGESISSRKKRFLAFITAFILTFTCLGPYMVMAKELVIKNHGEYSAPEIGQTFEKGDKISWSGAPARQALEDGQDFYVVDEIYYYNPGFEFDDGLDFFGMGDVIVREPEFSVAVDFDPSSGHSYTVLGYDNDLSAKADAGVTAGEIFNSSYNADVADCFKNWKLVWFGQNATPNEVKEFDHSPDPTGYSYIHHMTVCLEAQAECEVTFDPNNGGAFTDAGFTDGSKTKTVKTEFGKQITDPGDFEGTIYRAGYNFNGWYLFRENDPNVPGPQEPAVPDKYPFESPDSLIYGNWTFYAIWEPARDVNVTFNIKDPDTGEFKEAAKKAVKYNGKVEPYVPEENNGYTLNGWYELTARETFRDTPFDFDGRIKENIDLYGEWVPVQHTVTFNTNGGSAVKAQDVTHNEKAVKPEDPTKNGIVFEGWFTDNSTFKNAYNFDSPVTEDLILYAKWKGSSGPTGKRIPFDDTGKLLQVVIYDRTENSITVSWNKIPDADGYFVYFKKCHTYPLRKVADITDINTLSFTRSGLKKGTYYKFKIKAYKKVGNKKKVILKSLIAHGVTIGSSKYTIAKDVKITGAKGADLITLSEISSASGNSAPLYSLKLKQGQKVKIKAEEVPEEEGKKIEKHRGSSKKNPNIHYQSNDPKVAKVTLKGKIKAVSPGTCKIFAVSQSGMLNAIRVTVE